MSGADKCKRFLVTLIRSLASFYGCSVKVTRDSSNTDVKTAYRSVSKKAHPDHGGNGEDQQRLNAAYKEWCDVVFEASKKTSSKKGGKGGGGGGVVVVLPTTQEQKSFWFRSQAVLLTYQSFPEDLATSLEAWGRFLTFVRGSLRTWAVTRWTATLETNVDGKHHGHLMLQFVTQKNRNVNSFCFEGLRPNAAANDLLGENFSTKRWQSSVDRGHFYCWANKRGTVRDNLGNLCVLGSLKGQGLRRRWKRSTKHVSCECRIAVSLHISVGGACGLGFPRCSGARDVRRPARGTLLLICASIRTLSEPLVFLATTHLHGPAKLAVTLWLGLGQRSFGRLTSWTTLCTGSTCT